MTDVCLQTSSYNLNWLIVCKYLTVSSALFWIRFIQLKKRHFNFVYQLLIIKCDKVYFFCELNKQTTTNPSLTNKRVGSVSSLGNEIHMLPTPSCLEKRLTHWRRELHVSLESSQTSRTFCTMPAGSPEENKSSLSVKASAVSFPEDVTRVSPMTSG